MPVITYSSRRRSFVRSTLILLVAAGTGYVAGALLHNTVPSRDVYATFAPVARAAEPNPGISLPATVTAALVGPDERGRIQEPRECDLAQGISTTCLFMD